ncbi:unnamed protein product [Laminaria digitata]
MTCRSEEKPFSGDWRQVGPVVPCGTQTEVTEQAFLSSHLWNHVHRFRLTVSMRDNRARCRRGCHRPSDSVRWNSRSSIATHHHARRWYRYNLHH